MSFSQMYGRRFSDEEQMAFGRWAHLNARSHLGGIAGHSLGLAASRRASASEPSLLSPPDDSRRMSKNSAHSPLTGTATPVPPPSREALSMDGSPNASPGKQQDSRSRVDPSLVRSVLEQLLPAEDVPSPAPNLVMPGHIAVSDRPPSRNSRPVAFISTSPSGDARSVLGVPTPSDRARSQPSTTSSSDIHRSIRGAFMSQALVPLSPKSGLKRPRSVVRYRLQVLERFRWQLLQRFRSLHDAFARLHDLTTREHALSQEEFCQAFVALGVREADCMTVFEFMDFKGRASVSLAELRVALVTTSRQALLWELRCRLLTQGITPNDFSKVRKILEVARRPRHRTVRQRRRLQGASRIGNYYVGRDNGMPVETNNTEACAEDSETELFFKAEATYAWAETYETRTGFLPSSSRLSRADWLHVCSAIGLTLLEAERLFTILSGTAGMVDLQEMFTVLRAGVAPHVSLERFATRVLTRFGSLHHAFAAACDPVARVVRWPEFHSLAVTLDVKDDNAERLWRALNLAQQSREEATESLSADVADGSHSIEGSNPIEDAAADSADQEVEEGAVTESTFVKELTVWAPSTALDALRNQVDEHFSDLSEFRYALTEAGWALNSSVSVEDLEKALLAVGVTGCNGERIFSAVSSSWRGGRKGGSVTLEDIIEALLSTNSAANGSMARSAVRDDLRAIWQQLHTVQADLRSTTPASSCRQLLDAEEVGAETQCKLHRSTLCTAQKPRSRMRGSASLPSLRGAMGQRSRAARHVRRRGAET